mmetsp:Transcript_2690/g.8320  ORF Transcript_2690/g.8320 Transcript_2690/m.8320 type:complete len:218 (+) Transcript_2690:399-1052(+)
MSHVRVGALRVGCEAVACRALEVEPLVHRLVDGKDVAHHDEVDDLAAPLLHAVQPEEAAEQSEPVRHQVLVVRGQRGHQKSRLALCARLEDKAVVCRVEEEGARLGVCEHLDEHVLGREREHVVLRRDAEALAQLPKYEWRVLLEAVVGVAVRRRLGRARGEEVALPILIELGGAHLGGQLLGRELAHRSADAHEHHKDELERVVVGRDHLGGCNLG